MISTGDKIRPATPNNDKETIMKDSIVKAETPSESPVIFGSRICRAIKMTASRPVNHNASDVFPAKK